MTHLIDEMLKSLGPVLKNRDRARRILERYWKGKIAIIWTVQDVYRAANERKLALTEREAVEILTALYQSHNAQYGLKWEDLIAQIEGHCLGRKMTKAEIRRFVERDAITIQK